MTEGDFDENTAPCITNQSTEKSPELKKRRFGSGSEVCMERKSTPLRAHVSVRIHKGVALSTAFEQLSQLENFLKTRESVLNWKSFPVTTLELTKLIYNVSVGCYSHPDGIDLADKLKSFKLTAKNVHFYRPCEDGSMAQELSLENDSDDVTVGSQLWNLPCIEFENIWENLVYDTNLKNEVMSYVYSLVHLSEMGADMKVINVNRLILLLGPPGTGKTSLCRGLTQHLSVRLNDRFPRAVMIEINSHSLFSKWFSESGKLVLKMFDQIDELAEDKKCMVFVLIDEVESLGMSRESSSSRGDPADSIRAVNALLTQIDRIRRRENVLVLCTSNLENCLDRALLDRADMVRHVGRPSQRALYSILSDCVAELQRIGIVESEFSLCNHADSFVDARSKRMWKISEKALGLSGRAIRQIPALACSKSFEDSMTLDECLDHFEEAVLEKSNKVSVEL